MTKTVAKMDPAKARRLRTRGWRIGTAADFLGLTDEEVALVEMKISLADAVRKSREAQGITQAALAKRLASSQSRVARIESGGPGVSLDLLVRAALAAGATRSEVGAAIAL